MSYASHLSIIAIAALVASVSWPDGATTSVAQQPKCGDPGIYKIESTMPAPPSPNPEVAKRMRRCLQIPSQIEDDKKGPIKPYFCQLDNVPYRLLWEIKPSTGGSVIIESVHRRGRWFGPFVAKGPGFTSAGPAKWILEPTAIQMECRIKDAITGQYLDYAQQNTNPDKGDMDLYVQMVKTSGSPNQVWKFIKQ